MATIRDVAREAGVSPATVSRHLNGNIELPAETAGRIDAASKRLGYRPNLLAKRLSLGSSETIGLVTPEIANPFFAALAAAAEDEARRAGFSILLSSTGGDLEMEAASIDRLAARHVDGLLVLTNRVDDGRLRDLIDGRTDVVLLDEDVPGANVTRIFVENEAGACDATRHLIAAGHRRIAHIGGPEQLLSSRERFAGFAGAMAGAGLAVEDGLVRFGAYERDFGRDATRAILAEFRPTAVFTGSDYIAIGVLQELAAHGLSVPGDLSLASFDDMPFADLLSPPITTVRQPIEALGRLGIRTLLARIRGEDPPPIQRLPTELVIRKSVGPPPGKAKKKTG